MQLRMVMLFAYVLPIPDYGLVLLALLNGFVLGGVVGWWLRRRRSTHEISGGALHENARKSESPEWKPDQAREFLVHVREVTTGVAQDVHQHTSQVKSINESLASVSNQTEKPSSEAILNCLIQTLQANENLQSKLASAESKLQLEAEKVDRYMSEAITDSLTELGNRRALDAELRRRLAELRRNEKPLSLLLVDLDHFKNINDRHGHQVGDTVLKALSKMLSATAREMDLVARYGGDEFAIILSGATLIDAMKIAERVRTTIAKSRFRVEGVDIRLTISVGLVEAMSGDDDASLVRRADAALFEAKHDGRNCAFCHEGEKAERVSISVPEELEEQHFQC